MGKRFFGQKKIVAYALLAAISFSSLGWAQVEPTSPREALMLRRISEYWKDGDYASVKRHIGQFLEENPNTTLRDHLNAMLGDLYFQGKNFRQALATYNLIGNPTVRTKTFFNHLQAHFELRDYLPVIEKAEDFIQQNYGSSSPKIVHMRYLLAESYFRHALKCSDPEQKTYFLKLAKPHYKVLTQTKYSARVLFPLAEVHRLLREDDRAANLYIKLSQKFPEHRERFLFQAAILQIRDYPKEAVSNFYKVHEMGGKRSRLAAYNRLILLYQEEEYQNFLTFFDQVIDRMPENRVPLLQFYEGRCHYALGNYEKAISPFENYVTASTDRSKERRSAHHLLVNCGRQTKDLALVERTMASYKSSFPTDQSLPKMLMIHAQMCRENGNFRQAITDLRILADEHPGYHDAESVCYDYALLLSHTDAWGEARKGFVAFLQKYPNSERTMSAWRHLLNCSMEEMRVAGSEELAAAQENFISTLHTALSADGILSEREKLQYTLVMVKCLCEMDRYEEAIPYLTHILNDSDDLNYLAEGHFLTALCHQQLGSDLSLFVQHAEKALSLDPNMVDNDLLHIELYNAYLTKGQLAEDEHSQDFYMRNAAEHLFASKAWSDRSIKTDNHLWLVNYFYQSAREGFEEDFNKTKMLYEDLLGLSEGMQPFPITQDNLYLENEALKYAHLLEIYEMPRKQIAVLQALSQKQEQQLPWKLQRRTFLELGKAHEHVGELSIALDYYDHLLKSGKRVNSIVNNTAQLHKARLVYSLLPMPKKTSENPDVIGVLHALKDLQIQKKLPGEPIHLEAALQYAEIRIALARGESPAKDELFFYKRMYDDFHAQNDSIAEEYHHLRKTNYAKSAIFSSYMAYIDAKMLLCQVDLALQDNRPDRAQAYKEQALELIDELLENKQNLMPYLLPRVQQEKAEQMKRI